MIDHLLVTRDSDGHIHVHGPIGDKMTIRGFLVAIAREAGIKVDED